MTTISTLHPEATSPRRSAGLPLWVFTAAPVILFTIFPLFIYAPYFLAMAIDPALMGGVTQADLSWGIFAVLVLGEWAFALLLIWDERRQGRRLIDLIRPAGQPLLAFRKGPALLVMLLLNLPMAVYLPWAASRGMLQSYAGLRWWQLVFLVTVLPLTAAFCEEIIWRGGIITRMEQRYPDARRVLLWSSVAFALMHGILLPLRMLVNFIYGVIAGAYYQRERSLVPLMITHLILDMWGFGLLYWFI